MMRAKQKISLGRIALCGLVAFTLVCPGSLLAQTQTISCAGGFDAGLAPIPPIPLLSLKTVPNPVLPNGAAGAPRADLLPYIANQASAIQLGKALFWDMQVGSDNQTACATCHVNGGADIRTRNQVNPGTASSDGFNANAVLTAADFPLIAAHSTSDNIVGSQGVRKSLFQGVSNTGVETSTSVADPVFNAGGANVRQVTGIQAPSIFNAVFNHRLFWNGRAQPEFNGTNPWGNRDISARIWTVNSSGNIVTAYVRIPNAGLASQATGPALSDVEMSASGRTFPDIGRKMLKLKPLGLQKVDGKDSVLGRIADTRAGKGLKTTYVALIQQAFQPQWWNSTKTVTINAKTYSLMEANFSFFWGLAIMLYQATLVTDDSPMDQYLAGRTIDPLTGALTKDGTPTKLSAAATRLAAEYGYNRGVNGILNGLMLFEKPLPPFGTGRECIACHLGPNTTSASVANLVQGGLEPGDAAFKTAGFDLRMERMFMQIPPVPLDFVGMILNVPNAPAYYTDEITFDPSSYRVDVTHMGGALPFSPPFQAPTAVYDAGWYNVGVRPIAENSGLAGSDPFGAPLSWIGLIQSTYSDPGTVRIPGGTLGCVSGAIVNGQLQTQNPLFPFEVLNASGFPLLSGSIRRSEPVDVPGSFKTSQLRNVELTGPYFHNGGKSTLKQLVDFYDDGGDFPAPGNPQRGPFPTDSRSPIIKFYGELAEMGKGLTPEEASDMVAFLLSLTDERVRWEKAPFDHPQLIIPHGVGADGKDIIMDVPAVGAGGRTQPVKPFLGLNPFALQ